MAALKKWLKKEPWTKTQPLTLINTSQCCLPVYVPRKDMVYYFTNYENNNEIGVIVNDLKHGKWNKIKSYPKDVKVYDSTAAFDKVKDVIYIYGGSYTVFLAYYIKDNRFETIVRNESDKANINKFNIGRFPSSIIINSTLHVIGGEENNFHFTLDLNSKPNYKFIVQAVIPGSKS